MTAKPTKTNNNQNEQPTEKESNNEENSNRKSIFDKNTNEAPYDDIAIAMELWKEDRASIEKARQEMKDSNKRGTTKNSPKYELPISIPTGNAGGAQTLGPDYHAPAP